MTHGHPADYDSECLDCVRSYAVDAAVRLDDMRRELEASRALADRLAAALAGVQHGSCDGCNNVQNDRYCPECKEERFDYDGDPLPDGGWPERQPNHLATCATGAALEAWRAARR